MSLVIGSPDLPEGIVNTNMDRSPTDRLRMVALPPGSRRLVSLANLHHININHVDMQEQLR